MQNWPTSSTTSNGAGVDRPNMARASRLEDAPSAYQVWPKLNDNVASEAPHSAPRKGRFIEAGRRLFDIVFAAFALLATAPIFAVLLLMIRGSSRGPAVYKHRRIGRNGRQFDCLKFRTMVEDADQALDKLLAECADCRTEFQATYKLKNDPRITSVGKFLRKTSLDELPQFWNVLRGDMSVVGPRPIVEEERERYGADLPVVLSVRPGLTGLWQVSGRNDLDYQSRVELDKRYVLNQRFASDMQIILKTVSVMVKKDGAY
jgi:lipopolysaccharide/colanic/teichoic acid biosynthesis glycosyltransferase